MKTWTELFSQKEFYLFITIVIVLIALAIWIIYDYVRNPFQPPIIKYGINISGRRQPSYEECIDEWINSIRGHGRAIAAIYNKKLNLWENECEKYIRHTFLWKGHKRRLFDSIRNEAYARDYKIFSFGFYRFQTRYKQVNYKKNSYQVKHVEFVMSLSLHDLLVIDDELEEINYGTTRAKYYSKNQRKLMTKDLRRRIILRDNYTCQMCGKYMPDEVGLHVDHIIPIKYGGKSIESNLQVLCDKCNLSKGKKIRI